jgi:hypothetical protein
MARFGRMAADAIAGEAIRHGGRRRGDEDRQEEHHQDARGVAEQPDAAEVCHR